MALAIGIILGCCALGAGIAMIAGIGPGKVKVTQLLLRVRLLVVSQKARALLQQP